MQSVINSDEHTLVDYYDSPGSGYYERFRGFRDFIEDGKDRRRFYYERKLVSPCENRVRIFDEYESAEREMVMFGSNNYLGLAAHPRIREAAIRAICKYGTGSGSVPLFSGTFAIHKELEAEIAAIYGHEDSVLFTSGYAANLACMISLVGSNDIAIHDRLNHASIFEGSKLSGSKMLVYGHSDIASLGRALDRSRGARKSVVVTDGVFSMDGDVAALPGILEIASACNAVTVVDEAHALGVIGNRGMGTLERYGLEGKVDAVTGCLSKAIGSVGGYVSSSREIVNYVRYYGRSSMFSSSLPPADVAAALEAIAIIKEEPERVARLRSNSRYMRENLKTLGFDTGATESAIVPVVIGDEVELRRAVGFLHDRGIYVNGVPYPAVPKKSSRIRLGIMATHTGDDMNQALDAFAAYGKTIGRM